MSLLRTGCVLFLLFVFLAAIGAPWFAPESVAAQHRDAILAPPSPQHLLGTDDIGRDILSRLLYGTRISLLVAPASAAVATLLALLIGSAAGLLGSPLNLALHRVIDLFLSVPWIFLLLIVRALLPLNVSPLASLSTTVLVLGAFGWAASARVISESVAAISASGYCRHARAQGLPPVRRFLRHIVPNLRPILFAQFWVAVPVFIIGEANLGFLGLGVSEPLPSWGNLLRQLENLDRVAAHPWLLSPLLLVILVLAGFQVTLASREQTS